MTPPKKAQSIEELKLELAMARAEVEQMRRPLEMFKSQIEMMAGVYGIYMEKLQQADYFTMQEAEMYHKKGIVALLTFWQNEMENLEGRRKVPQTRMEEMMQDAVDRVEKQNRVLEDNFNATMQDAGDGQALFSESHLHEPYSLRRALMSWFMFRTPIGRAIWKPVLIEDCLHYRPFWYKEVEESKGEPSGKLSEDALCTMEELLTPSESNAKAPTIVPDA